MPETQLALATGRRKTAVARVRLFPGTGQVLVNGRPMDQYFPRQVLCMRLQDPFQATNLEGRYDIRDFLQRDGIDEQRYAQLRAEGLGHHQIMKQLHEEKDG